MSDVERRKFPRVLLQAEVNLNSADNFYAGRTRDLSLGGLFVEGAIGLVVGSSLMVHLTLEGADLVLPCEVVWAIEGASGHSGVGLRFLSLSSAHRASIEAFMARRAPMPFEDNEVEEEAPRSARFGKKPPPLPTGG